MTSRDRKVRSGVLERIRDDRATAVVEFAIIFPLLIILIFGMVDFGRAFFLRNNLVAAVREGARMGATPLTGCASTAAIRTRVRQYVTAFGGTTLTDAQIPVAYLYTDGTTSNCSSGTQATNVRVSISGYAFTPITPVMSLLGRTGTTNINVSATYRWESSPVP
jgi:Flp pilus assembly protein TadG